MNKRQEIANRVWLVGFDGDKDWTQAEYVPTRDSLADRLHAIGSGYRYTVEMRKELDTYYVRLYPPAANRPIGQPPVCISYSGTHLGNILAAAVTDLARLRNPENRWTIRAREFIRWVA